MGAAAAGAAGDPFAPGDLVLFAPKIPGKAPPAPSWLFGPLRSALAPTHRFNMLCLFGSSAPGGAGDRVLSLCGDDCAAPWRAAQRGAPPQWHPLACQSDIVYADGSARGPQRPPPAPLHMGQVLSAAAVPSSLAGGGDVALLAAIFTSDPATDSTSSIFGSTMEAACAAAPRTIPVKGCGLQRFYSFSRKSSSCDTDCFSVYVDLASALAGSGGSGGAAGAACLDTLEFI